MRQYLRRSESTRDLSVECCDGEADPEWQCLGRSLKDTTLRSKDFANIQGLVGLGASSPQFALPCRTHHLRFVHIDNYIYHAPLPDYLSTPVRGRWRWSYVKKTQSAKAGPLAPSMPALLPNRPSILTAYRYSILHQS